MDFFETLNARRSVRSYTNRPVEKEKLDSILEAARIAPTAVNYQAFRIFVLPTAGRQEELMRIYPKDWFVQAPLVIGVCTVKDKCWVRRDGKSYGDVDSAIVMDHMILAATALGLGTCWIGNFRADAAREILKLDDGLEPVAFTPVGYAQDRKTERIRKPLSELLGS